jgi:hypothetical protein
LFAASLLLDKRQLPYGWALFVAAAVPLQAYPDVSIEVTVGCVILLVGAALCCLTARRRVGAALLVFAGTLMTAAKILQKLPSVPGV